MQILKFNKYQIVEIRDFGKMKGIWDVSNGIFKKFCEKRKFATKFGNFHFKFVKISKFLIFSWSFSRNFLKFFLTLRRMGPKVSSTFWKILRILANKLIIISQKFSKFQMKLWRIFQKVRPNLNNFEDFIALKNTANV